MRFALAIAATAAVANAVMLREEGKEETKVNIVGHAEQFESSLASPKSWNNYQERDGQLSKALGGAAGVREEKVNAYFLDKQAAATMKT